MNAFNQAIYSSNDQNLILRSIVWPSCFLCVMQSAMVAQESDKQSFAVTDVVHEDRVLLQDPTSVISLAKIANVRLAPSLNAKVVATLNVGDQVEVLGTAQGTADWYVIRFPREGLAWIHEQAIQLDVDGKKAKVIEESARVRGDASQGGEIVAQLALGEVVEIRDRARVGSWVPIYPPSAVAYIHKSLLATSKVQAPVVSVREPQDNHLDELWIEVQNRHTAYKSALEHDVEVGATLDWGHLDSDLSLVVEGHHSENIKIAAKRLRDSIGPIVSAAVQVQRDRKITPVREVPGQ